MSSQRHVAVLIPAKDEGRLLARALHSVVAACSRLPTFVSADIVVVADDCSDDTLVIASQVVGHCGTALSRSFGCVGQARHEAALEAIRRSPIPLNRCWLANTDADCVVPIDWLVDQLCLDEAGYDGVAGIIDIDTFAEHEAYVSGRFYETYLLHSDGTHPHVHGANMGFKADAYIEVGGWSALGTAEDHDLWKRLKSANYRLKSDSSLKVITSGRRIGRAPMGFASALAAHNEAVA